MDCPNCQTYNPDERTVCWRCDKPLPKPEVKERKRPGSSQHWLYLLIGIMLLMMLVNMCGLPNLLSSQSGPAGSAPSGMVVGSPGAVV
mgnify:CR=1 FL=1